MPPLTTPCKICGTPFISKGLAKTCSKECSAELKRLNKNGYNLRQQREILKEQQNDWPERYCCKCAQRLPVGHWRRCPECLRELRRHHVRSDFTGQTIHFMKE